MNKYHVQAIVFLTIVGGLGWAFYQMQQGSTSAAMLLGAVGAILAIFVAVFLVIGTQYALSAIEQRHFSANAKENLAIMATMALAQSKQNQLLSKQVRTLPDGTNNTIGGLIIDQNLFEELE